MSISITGGPLERRGGGYHSTETLSKSTATAAQAISLTTDLVLVGMGTDTGTAYNRFTVADGTEGQEIHILATATGEANILPSNGTSTGWHVLSAADDGMVMKFANGKWRVLQSSATTSADTV